MPGRACLTWRRAGFRASFFADRAHRGAGAGSLMFRLVKWYFDLVTRDGSAVIGYVARGQWGALDLRYGSVCRSTPGSPLEERATSRRVAAPQTRGDGELLRWGSPALGVSGQWRGTSPTIDQTLLSGSNGVIQWSCRMPRAKVTFRWDHEMLRGLGYVERLRLTVPPWRLPFRTLRWGRYVSARHALVWIDWDGRPGAGQPARKWIWLDGRERCDARMEETAPGRLGEDRSLQLLETRELRDRRVLGAIGPLLPGLARLAGRLGGMRERKWLSRAALVRAGSEDTGWAIHEVVRW